MPSRLVFPVLFLAAMPARAQTQTQSQTEAQADQPSGGSQAAPAQNPAPRTQPAMKAHGNAITLSLPQSFDFSQTKGSSPGADQARKLRNAPLPDPDTIRKPDRSLKDPNTGADVTPFGTAYSYANPLYGPQGAGSVQNAASKSAATYAPQAGIQLVLFQWGYPRPPMPRVPGDDLTAAPPPVPVIDFAVQADNEPVLDAKASGTIGRAVQAYGRAALTKITIEKPARNPNCCARYPELVRAALIGSGLGPDHLLPGHQIRVVMAVLPVQGPVQAGAGASAAASAGASAGVPREAVRN